MVLLASDHGLSASLNKMINHLIPVKAALKELEKWLNTTYLS